MRNKSNIKKKAMSVLIGTLALTAVFPMEGRADDALYHVSDNEAEIIEADNEVPVIKIKKVEIENQTGEYGTGAIVTIEAEDVGISGLAEKAYSFNENDWQEENTYHVGSDGIVFFSVRDAAGNIVDGQAEVRGIDREAPVITVTEKENDTKNGIMKLEIKAEDKGGGITGLSWQNDEVGVPVILQENGDGQKSVCKEVTVESNGSYSFFAEDVLHNRSSQTVKVMKIRKEDEKEKERQKEREKEREKERRKEKDKGGEDNRGDRKVVAPMLPKNETKAEPDAKKEKDETVVIASHEEKSEKSSRGKVIAGNKGSVSDVEYNNSFRKKIHTGSGNEINCSFREEEDYAEETTASENIIDTTVYYADSDDDADIPEDYLFDDMDDEIVDLDLEQGEVRTEKKSAAGIVVGGMMILVLSALSVFILWKKEIIKMPVDTEHEDEIA